MTDNATTNAIQGPTRNLFLRILFGFLWFVLFYFVTNILVGAVVGGIAGASSGGSETNFAAGYSAGATAGRDASLKFFHKYGLLVLLSQVLIFAILCVIPVFPGVGKYKKVKLTSQPPLPNT